MELLDNLKSLTNVAKFFHKLRHKELVLDKKTPIEDVTKKLKRKVPAVLEGCKVHLATYHRSQEAG